MAIDWENLSTQPKVTTPTGSGIDWENLGNKYAEQYNYQQAKNKVLDISKLPAQSAYNQLNQARQAGIISKEEHLAKIKEINAREQAKIKSNLQKSITPIEVAKSTAGTIGRGVVGAGGALVGALTSNLKRIGEGYGEVIGEATGVSKKARQAQAQSEKISATTLKSLSDILINPNASAEQKARARLAIQNISKTSLSTSIESARRQAEIAERTDPLKGLAAIGGIGLDVLTAGTLPAIKGAIKVGKGLSTAQKVAKVARPVAGGAGIGGLYGALSEVEQKGAKATPSGIAKSAGAGALFGGGLVGAGIVLPKAIQKIKSTKVAQEAVEKATITAKDIKTRTSFVENALSEVGKQIEKTSVGNKIISAKDTLATKLVDNLHTVEKPFIGKVDVTGRTVVERIRELATNVRQATGMAAYNRTNNKSWQELGELIQKNGGKKAMQETADFIKLKQNAINAGKVSGKKAVIPKGTDVQEKAYQLLNKSTKDEVQKAFDAGLIDKVKYNSFMKDTNYTRVQRKLDDALNYPSQGSAEASISSTVLQQKLKGSTKEALDPYASYIDWSNKITTQIERNKMATYITDQLLDEKLARTAITGETNTLARFRDGVKELIATDPKIVDSIKNMDKVAFGGLQRYVTIPSRALQAGATGFNVAFSVPNIIRDELSSLILSKNPLATHNPLAIWQGIKEAMIKPTVNAVARGLKITGKGKSIWEPSVAFKKYIAANSQMTTVDLARNLKSATRQASEEFGLKGESWIRKLESINSASEKMGRFQNFIGTYKKMLKKGLPDEEALARGMQAARENGIDFSQRGEYATFARLFNPYFNASIQGSRSLARALKERPIATTTKIGAVILTPIAGTTYWNLSDPKRAAVYANIPEYERESNLIFVTSEGQYIKVPLPPGVKEFGQPLRKVIETEYLGDKTSLLETAKSMFIDAFSPVGNTPSELVGNLVPQGGKPLVENMLNRSFYKNQPIVGENLTDLPPEEQVYKSTPQAYKDLGKMFNISPLQVQNTIRGYGAGGAEQLVSIVDAARTSKSLKEAVNKAVTDRRGTVGQIKGRFTGKVPEGGGAVTTKFYDEYDVLQARRNSVSKKVTTAVKSGDYKKARTLIEAFNRTVDEQNKKFKTTYGKYETSSDLLDTLNKLKLSTKDSALKARAR